MARLTNNELKEMPSQAPGTRILCGGLAAARRELINEWVGICMAYGYDEIVLPSVEYAKTYTDKAGPEILGQMYEFYDKGNPPRHLCLRPEGTATCQLIADRFKYTKDVKLFYEVRCWRYERPQTGRYREFTQFGVEVLNPSKDYMPEMLEMAKKMLSRALPESEWVVNESVKRGLAYYTQPGFEVEVPSLGAQKQVLGGGAYEQGVGFAIGLDRVLVAMNGRGTR